MKDAALTVALAQVTPVWMDRDRTLDVVLDAMKTAGDQRADLIVFPEAFCPGYPFWLAHTDGAAWERPLNKALHAHYMDQAVSLESGHLDPVCRMASQMRVGVYLGIVERPADRGGHSLYCSLVFIDAQGVIRSVHRKLQPTYEERLVWSPGDGHGLQVHAMGAFRLGGLNCWENWMPLARTALYAQGENVHIAVWPGSDYNTRDLTRFVAREARSYVCSVSSVMKAEDLPESLPFRAELLNKGPKVYANGGSCVAGPDGNWLLEPQLDRTGLLVQELSLETIYRERQNFDPSGHYSRPDVTRLSIDRRRQGILDLNEGGKGFKA